MATHRKFLLAAQSHWQARHRLRFSRWPGVSEGSELMSYGTWGEDLRTGRGLAGRDRSVPTGQTQAGHRQLAQVPAGQSDPRASVEGRQPNLRSEDLSQPNDRRVGKGPSVRARTAYKRFFQKHVGGHQPTIIFASEAA